MGTICPTCLTEIDCDEHARKVTCACGTSFDPSEQGDDLPPLSANMMTADSSQSPPEPEVEVSEVPMHEPEAKEPSMEEVTSSHHENAFPNVGNDSLMKEPPLSEQQEQVSSDASLSEPQEESIKPFDELLMSAPPVKEDSKELPLSEGFSESEDVFKEIRDFGDSVVTGKSIPAAKESKPAPPSQKEVFSNPPPAATPPSPAPEVPVSGVDSKSVMMTSGSTLQGYQIEQYFSPLSLSCTVSTAQEEPLKPAFDKLWSRTKALGGNGVIDLKWVLSPDSTRVLISGIPVKCVKVS